MFSDVRSLIRRTSKITVVIIVLLVVLRACLPYAVRTYVNRTLDRVPQYAGSIGDVDIALIRGAYSIENVEILKTTGKIPEPYFSADLVDFSVQWGALLEGKWVGEVEVDNGQLNFVKAPSEKNSQIEVKSEWLDVIKDLFPLRLNRFELRDAEITYNDHHSDPKVKVVLTDVNVIGRNFSNTRSSAEGLVAYIDSSGFLEKKAKVVLNASLEPSAKKPTFKGEASLESFPIRNINDFLLAYGNVDAERGTISVYSEVEAKNGKLRGYIKPLVRDLKLLGRDNGDKSIWGEAWQVIVAALAEVFENQSLNQIATNIEIEGSLDKPETSTLQTIWGIIKNAFVEAFKPGWEKVRKTEN